MSEMGRLSGVLFDPKTAFADIAERPRWWAPLILIIAVSLTFITLYSSRVGWETMMRQNLENNSRTANMPADQRERAIEQGAKFAGIIGYVGVLVGTPLVFVIIAGVLLLAARTVLGAPLTFRQTFAITAYSMLTGLVSGILAMVVMFLKRPEDFNLQNPLAFNIGAFLDPSGTAKWLYSLASSMDLFAIWTVLLLATGLSAAGGRRVSWNKALTVVGCLWLVVVLVKAGWAGMMG